MVPAVGFSGMSYICHAVISKDMKRIYFLSRSVEESMEGVFLDQNTGLFCPSDGIANSHRMHTRKRIRLKRALQSDGSCRVNRMRFRPSIRCAFAFQSIETFFGFLI
jgi:hypothetical protein